GRHIPAGARRRPAQLIRRDASHDASGLVDGSEEGLDLVHAVFLAAPAVAPPSGWHSARDATRPKGEAVSTATNIYLAGNFAPVSEELTAEDLPVTGRIPEELHGRYLRNGPNPVEPDPAAYHWFTGTGMVHGIRLEGGAARWYRNR